MRELGCEESRDVERVQPGVGSGHFVVSMFFLRLRLPNHA